MQFARGTQVEVLVLICGALALIAGWRSRSTLQWLVQTAIYSALVAATWASGLWQGELFPGAGAPQLVQVRWVCAAMIFAALGASAGGYGRLVLALGVPLFCLLQLPATCDVLSGHREAIQIAVAAAAIAGLAALPQLAPEGPNLSVRRYWLAAIWCALVISFVENGLRALRSQMYGALAVSGHELYPLLPARVFWLVPLGNLLALSLLALVVSLPRCFSSRARVPGGALFLLAYATAFIAVARATPSFDLVATYAITAGIAGAASQFVLVAPDRLHALVRRSTPWLAAATIVVAVFAESRSRIAERRQLDALAEAPAEARNILLIVLDTVRAQSLGLYGYERATTPQLEAFARRATVFEHAVAPCSWTLPTHASLFTGRLPHEHKADSLVPLDARYPTLAELFQARGYQTAGFVANRIYCGAHTGLARGFIHYEEHDRVLDEMLDNCPIFARLLVGVAPSTRKTAIEINRQFSRWLDRRRPRPFFAFLNYYDAHEPYYVPDASFDRFGRLPAAERQRLLAAAPLTSDTAQAAIDTYDGAIAYLDHYLGRLFADLRRRDLLDETCVVITSDHGENFGEQGEFGHGFSLYREQIQVPLVIRAPDAGAAPTRVSSVVGLLDVPKTILELARIDAADDFRGASLCRFYGADRASPVADETALSELLSVVSTSPELQRTGPVFSLIADGRHYIAYLGAKREELFDFRVDNLEQHDLAASPLAAAELERFRRLLNESLETGPQTSAMRASAPRAVNALAPADERVSRENTARGGY